MRAFSGFCFAGAAMIVESWLNEVAENKSRGTIFSIYTTINMTASTLGQLAMSVTGVDGYLPFVVGAISFICAVLPTGADLDAAAAAARLGASSMCCLLYRTSPLAVIAAFAVGMANGTFGTLAPVYGHDQGLDAAGIAYLFALTAVLGADRAGAVRPAQRHDGSAHGHRLPRRLRGGGRVPDAADQSAGRLADVSCCSRCYGFSAYPIYAIAVAHANDFAKKGEFGRVAGGMLLTMGTGLAIGPAIAALVMNLYQPVGLFIVTATFHGALAVTAFLRMRVRPVRVDGRIRFRAMNAEKGVSPGTVALDPRSGRLAGKSAARRPPTGTAWSPETIDDHGRATERDHHRARNRSRTTTDACRRRACSDKRTRRCSSRNLISARPSRRCRSRCSRSATHARSRPTPPGALLKSLMEADGHRCAERAVCRDDIQAIRAQVMKWVVDPADRRDHHHGRNGILRPRRDAGGARAAVRQADGGVLGAVPPIFGDDRRHLVPAVAGDRRADRRDLRVRAARLARRLPRCLGGILRAQLDNRHLPCNFVELMPRLAER